jgi:hypothetical protein
MGIKPEAPSNSTSENNEFWFRYRYLVGRAHLGPMHFLEKKGIWTERAQYSTLGQNLAASKVPQICYVRIWRTIRAAWTIQ